MLGVSSPPLSTLAVEGYLKVVFVVPLTAMVSWSYNGSVMYSIMMLMKFSDLSQSDCSNWVMWQVGDIGIDHDTVCAGVVCADTPGTARVEPAVAPAGSTSAVPGVAAQTTTAQTVWVVNFYSTMKTKQCTTINPAMIMTMSRHAKTPWLTTSSWWWKRP